MEDPPLCNWPIVRICLTVSLITFASLVVISSFITFAFSWLSAGIYVVEEDACLAASFYFVAVHFFIMHEAALY